jgi:hypothetical protein
MLGHFCFGDFGSVDGDGIETLKDIYENKLKNNKDYY